MFRIALSVFVAVSIGTSLLGPKLTLAQNNPPNLDLFSKETYLVAHFNTDAVEQSPMWRQMFPSQMISTALGYNIHSYPQNVLDALDSVKRITVAIGKRPNDQFEVVGFVECSVTHPQFLKVLKTLSGPFLKTAL